MSCLAGICLRGLDPNTPFVSLMPTPFLPMVAGADTLGGVDDEQARGAGDKRST